MKTIRGVCLLICLAGLAVAQPTITAVQNSASNVPPGLPNSGIARGSLFVVKGTNLGGPTLVTAAAYPLHTNIGGTAVSVTVSGTTVSGIMYYSSSTQVAVILPSSTPLGDGTVTVSYNAQTSEPFPITVVPFALGIFTVNQTGAGDAIAFLNANGSLITPANAANPSDVVAFWGTGLAAVSFDETNAAEQFDMTNVPLEAFIGGAPAQVLFRGRNSCCTGIDVVYVRMPSGVSGCATPVTFKSGNVVSNTATIAVALAGLTCTPTNPQISSTDLLDLFSRGTIRLGEVSLRKLIELDPEQVSGGVTTPAVTHTSDSGNANFYGITVPAGGSGLSGIFDVASRGACTVVASVRGEDPVRPAGLVSLDAGSSLTVSGPGGDKTIGRNNENGVISYGSNLDATGTFLNPGAFSVSGSGGPDVASFSTSLNIPAPPVWSNKTQITEVTRANGVTVEWEGGDPEGFIQIEGGSTSSTSNVDSIFVYFRCTAKTSDKTFTVPPEVLLGLPATGSSVFSHPGYLEVVSSNTKQFQVSNLDFAIDYSSVTESSSVMYK